MNYVGYDSRDHLFVGKQIAWRLVMTKVFRGLILVLASASLLWAIEKPDDAPTTTILGFVRDSGCVHRFHEVVKPLATQRMPGSVCPRGFAACDSQ